MRNHSSKMQRAAVLGCAALAVSSTSHVIATTNNNTPSSYHVWPNNNPRRRIEKRRRLEQGYYRNLAAQQQQQQQVESSSTYDASSLRRLNTSGMHSKGYEYTPQGVHGKGNINDDEEDDNERPVPVVEDAKKVVEKMEFMLLGNNNVESSDPPPPPPPADNTVDDLHDVLATNLQKFTRIGGSGYTLPPSTRYPYMSSLQLEGHSHGSNDPYDVHMCGGVLVAPDIVMTAAHCAKYTPPGTDEIHAAFNGIEIGKSDLNDEGLPYDPYSLETYRLVAYENLVPKNNGLHVHPNYNEDTYEHDVMLVQVHGVSKYPPVKLYQGTEYDNEQPDTVTALGWGADSSQSQQRYSNLLKSATLDLLNQDTCRDIEVMVQDPITSEVSSTSLSTHIFDDMTCAKSEDRYICYGDAGGPVIIPGSNSDEDVVYGILSWGYGCVNHNYPAVITKISPHYDWIRNTICDVSSDPPEQYECPPQLVQKSSSGSKKTVTLKLKLDKMSIETGFVIELQNNNNGGPNEIVAQRQTGYYKSESNEIVLETMELPYSNDACYNLILVDSFGDGFCCDMGGGSATLYDGTDVGYYTGTKLVEVSGMFETENSGTFCLGSGTNTNVVPPTPPSPPVVVQMPPPPSPPVTISSPPPPPPATTTQAPPPEEEQPQEKLEVVSDTTILSSQGGDSSEEGSTTGSSQASWSGPVTNPEFAYCAQFCASSSSSDTMCGSYACVHTSDIVTSDSQEHEDPPPQQQEEEEVKEDSGGPLTSTQFYTEDSEYYLTVQIQFDDNPQEVSWVLYDLTTNEVRVFVDFDEYPKDTYANRLLNVRITMDGPDLGEKQYAFTVYDSASNGLCCDHGEGYYRVYLGDVDDDLELLGDDIFDFSSSYYFTLFENEGHDDDIDEMSSSPTTMPSKSPSQKPTKSPSKFPTQSPSSSPTTEAPSRVWEQRRPEDMNAIGARWSTRAKTLPGVFNDVGGDEKQYKFNMDRSSIRNGAVSPSDLVMRISVGLALMCSFALIIMQ